MVVKKNDRQEICKMVMAVAIRFVKVPIRPDSDSPICL